MDKLKKEKSIFVFVFVIVTFILTCVSMSIIFPNIWKAAAKNYSYNMAKNAIVIPTVNSAINSFSQGTNHNVSIDFTIYVNEKDINNLSTPTLHAQIMDIIQTLDYDMISSKDNIAYIELNVLSELSKFYDPGILNAIYITNIQSGENKIYSSDESSTKSNREKALDSLFPKMSQ